MIRLASGLLSISLILIASTAASVWFLESWLDRPGPLSEPLITVLEPGTGVKLIASQLVYVAAIDNPHLFALAVITKSKYGPLQAGEYSFPERVKPRTILAALTSGSTFTLIKEGKQTAKIKVTRAAETYCIANILPKFGDPRRLRAGDQIQVVR